MNMNVRDGNKVKFDEERKKATGDNNIFYLFYTRRRQS